jgi:hypothetical protein
VAPRDRTGRQPEVPPEVPPEYADEYLAAFHRALAEAGVPMMRESDDARTVPPAVEQPEAEDLPDVVVGEVVAPTPPAAAADEPPATEAFETVALAPDPVDDEPEPEADVEGDDADEEPDEPDEPKVERMEVWAFEPPERDPDEIFPPQPPPPAKWDFEAPREPVEDPLPPRWDFEPPPEPDPDWEFEEVPALPLDWAFEPVEDETGELPAVGDDSEAPAAREHDDELPARRGRPVWVYVLVFLVVAAVLMVSAYFLGMALSGSTGSAPALPVTGSAGV